MRKLLNIDLKITLQKFTPLLCLFLAISIYSFNAVAQQVIQIKTFTEDLKPFGNIQISINQGALINIPTNAIAFESLTASQFPVKSISIADKHLEAASWSLSKGILEITIRKKSYIDTPVKIIDSTNAPLNGVRVRFFGQKTVNKETNAAGLLILPLGLNEKIENKDQFKIEGFEIISLQSTAPYEVLVKQIPRKAMKPTEDFSTKEAVRDWNLYVIENLPLIDDLEQLYMLISEVPRERLNKSAQALMDIKFKDLMKQLSMGNGSDTNSYFNNISDTTIIERDLDNLLKQARKEGVRLSEQRIAFEAKIQIVRDKLNIGFENLDEQEKDDLLEDIKLLETILNTNKNEFYENQKSYQAIINELKRRFFDLKELENKLSESENERLKEKRRYQRNILAILAVVLLFALLIILLFYLRTRLKKQQNDLIQANKSVQLVNDNLEEIVSERTHLLEKTFKELDLVLYRASHDLRAPICSIAGLSDLLARDTGNNELTDLVLKTNNQMDKLLKKLSTISEIHQPGAFQEINLRSLVQEVTDKFNDDLTNHKININLICETGLIIKSIPYLIEVSLFNIIENAVNFLKIKENQQKHITIRCFEENESVKIIVEDNGIGIDQGIIDNVFEMFYVGTELSHGNGLGLYIVNKSINVLKGNIEILSEEHKFTKFTISLPIDDSKGHALDFMN